jgi:hypothetical protein
MFVTTNWIVNEALDFFEHVTTFVHTPDAKACISIHLAATKSCNRIVECSTSA